MRNSNFFKQKPIQLLGAVNQLLGAAIAWASMGTFLFSGIAAWNTPTFGYIRDFFPWLNLGSFIAIVVAGISFLMWVQHKYVQPSIMGYWGSMFWQEANAKKFVERQERIEKMLKELLEKNG